MSGGFPLGTRYDPMAPWNKKDSELDYGQCPRCRNLDTFRATTFEKGRGRVVKFVCRDCFKKFD